jgi:DNA-binding SARP family transcriptional activator
MASSAEQVGPDPSLICLLGRLSVVVGGCEQHGFEARRVQELLSYLVVHHDRQVPREQIADQLWGDGRAERRKQLRQTVWQLQHALAGAGLLEVLQVERDWIRVVSTRGLIIDVECLESAARLSRGVPGDELADGPAADLTRAVEMYRGDLLPTCYEDWCALERDRFRAIYLSLLDKLMARAESRGRYEEGLAYGELLLRHDRASERTHRRMMRLHLLAGDRTGALRQVDRCARALREELDVTPAPDTMALADTIRYGSRIDGSGRDPGAASARGTLGHHGGWDLEERDGVHELLTTLESVLASARALVAETLLALDEDRRDRAPNAGETFPRRLADG